MKGENRNKILKYILQICAVFVVLGFTSITAHANNCGGSYCGCDYSNCKGVDCWGTYPGECRGHRWYTNAPIYGNWVRISDPWCTTSGREARGVVITYNCHNCTKTGTALSTIEYRDIPALGHAGYGNWRNEGDVHAHYCTRCGGNREAQAHNWGAWHYQIDGYHYSDCEDRYACNARQDAVYSFTVYFNPNGGELIGSSSKTMAGGSSKHTLGTSARRTGYSFMGWGTSPVWGGARYDVTEQKQAYQWAQIFGKSIQYHDDSGTLYAQWERKITYTFYYWNGKQGTQITSSVTWHNGEDTNNRTMTIPNVARGDKDRLGQTWTFDGFDLDPSLKYTEEDLNKFTDVICDIDDTTSELSIPIGDLNVNYDKNYYTKYHTTVTMTYVDYGTDKQITRTSSIFPREAHIYVSV